MASQAAAWKGKTKDIIDDSNTMKCLKEGLREDLKEAMFKAMWWCSGSPGGERMKQKYFVLNLAWKLASPYAQARRSTEPIYGHQQPLYPLSRPHYRHLAVACCLALAVLPTVTCVRACATHYLPTNITFASQHFTSL